MGKITVSEFVTADGVMDEPMWTFTYWCPEIGAYKLDELFSSDALLLGRVTYQGFAQAWPKQTDEQGYADRMNGLPKHVVSTTLQTADWNNSTIVSGDVIAEISRLRQQPDYNLLIFGSRNLIKSLIEARLVDEYRLLVYPLTLGKGAGLFDGIDSKLQLTEMKSFPTGVVALHYAPAPAE
jgi:dihydrofolate reductase